MGEDMSCCPFGSDDFEGPSCYSECTRTARKEHTCDECEAKIRPGEQYNYESGVWDGRPSSYKTCLPCIDIRHHFLSKCNGNSWTYQTLWSDLQENFFPDMKAGGPCMEGMSPRGKAKMFEMYLAWYEQDEHDGAPPPRPYTPNEGTPP
jgi:hypothetical protein